jgi:hypothetical protein
VSAVALALELGWLLGVLVLVAALARAGILAVTIRRPPPRKPTTTEDPK